MATTRRPLAAGTATTLLDRIRAGEWELGHRLPGETTLAAELGVGRSTVREAVRELAGKGVLESRQGAGIFVTALDVAEERDAALQRASLTSVLEARAAVEAEAARLAALRRTATDLRRLRRALDDRVAGGHGAEDRVDADLAFHRAVVDAAHNDVLAGLFDGFVPRVRRAMVELLRASPLAEDHDHATHAALVDAIRAGDADAAADLGRTLAGGVQEQARPAKAVG